MSFSADKLERIFGASDGLESGLGIVETGYIAGGLSALFMVGFEVLGNSSALLESPSAVIASAKVSRLFGEMAEEMAKYVPSIPVLNIVHVSTLSGRLRDFSSEALVRETGANAAVAIVASLLCRFLTDSVTHFLSRCGELSDKSFSRALIRALGVLVEATELLSIMNLEINIMPSEQHVNTKAVLDILKFGENC